MKPTALFAPLCLIATLAGCTTPTTYVSTTPTTPPARATTPAAPAPHATTPAPSATPSTRATTEASAAAVSATLDSLHDAAAKADEDRYFDLYAKDGVFLGTDAKERWTLEEFKAFAHPYFAKGKAWTYIPIKGGRHITIEGQAQDVAWFDEKLENAKLGVCRGSGVLIKVNGAWKIRQYNLTMLVPNEIAEKVAKMSTPTK